MTRTQDLIERIVRRKRSLQRRGPLLVALSGIDGSGKTTLARKLENALAARGFRVALIGTDAWHQPALIRFGGERPAEHFYRHAFRFDELFRRLIDPLMRAGSVTLTANLIRMQPETLCPHTYHLRQIDIILLEGIFLFRQDLRDRYDLSFWIDCTFETALERARARNQEGLPKERFLADYASIYFPAQKIHLAHDWPRFFADAILPEAEAPAAPLALTHVALPPGPWRSTHAHEPAL